MGTEEDSTNGSARDEDSPQRSAARAESVASRRLAGRYLLGARLGRGGMGTVWRAQDEMLDREVAVKELSVNHLAEEDLLIVQSRMRQEARAAARIKHSGVVTIHDVLEQDGKPWIVMELIDGRSLAELVEQDGTLSPREAAGIGAQVLAALHRGHQVGVIHRDVKPANILIERATGRVVLTDFGIATYEGDSALTRTGDLIGSPDYLAPERVHGHRPGPESDLWGLGASLFAAVEGQSPFRRDSPLTTLAAVVTDPLPEPKRAGALAPVLRALMAKDAAERPDAPAAIRMLEDIAAGHTTNFTVPAVSAPLREPTAAVPLLERHGDRGEPTERSPQALYAAVAQRETEALRPNFVESEYRTAARPEAARPAPQRQSSHQDNGHDGRGYDSRGYDSRGYDDPGYDDRTSDYRDRDARDSRGGRSAPRRQRRVWPWLLVAGLLAALGGGGAAYEVSVRHSVDLHGWGIGGNRGGNPAPATSAPTNQADRPFKPVLAAGYTYTHDELGHFTFPLPPPVASGKPWVRMPGSSPLAIIYSPDNGIHKVIFGYNPNMVMSPREHAQDMEGDLLQNKTSYRQKSMVDGTVHGNLPATEWQYFFTGKDDKVLHHSIEELFNDHGTEYDVLVDYPESDWQTCYTRFHDILNGFTGDS